MSNRQKSAASKERTDVELWGMCLEGDESSWHLLIKRYEPLVCSVPRRAGLSEELVAEIFQDVFLALFQKLNGIKQPERLRAWLVTTAKFKTWNVVSLEKSPLKFRQEINRKNEMIFEISDNKPLADDVLVKIEEQKLIRKAINSMDERCRTILTMLYLNEIPASYAEIAARIGVSATSVSSLRARCLKKLLKLLAE